MKYQNILILAMSLLISNCGQNSKEEVKDAKKNMKAVRHELNDLTVNEKSALKAKTAENWKKFKTESDNAMTRLDQDLLKLEGTLSKINKRDKQKLDADFKQAKDDIRSLRDKLNKKSEDFESDVHNFSKKSTEEDEIFKEDFRLELEKVNLSVKKMIRDDKK